MSSRFEAELASLVRAHDTDLETLARAQRAAAERAEQQLESELRAAAKRLRTEHEHKLRLFRDTLKKELRLMKQVSKSASSMFFYSTLSCQSSYPHFCLVIHPRFLWPISTLIPNTLVR